MRKFASSIFVLCLAFGLCGCGLFGGGNETVPEAQAKPAPAEPAVEPAPAPAKPMTKAEKAAAAKKAKAEKAAAAKAEKAGKGGKKTEAQIQAELDATGKKLVAQAARTVMPSKASKSIRQAGKEFVATYVEVDQDSLSTSMSAGSTPGNYIGSIRYVEKVYECRGASKKAALSATCNPVKSRRMNELIHYNGKVWGM